jgi:hypothetical protein
MKMPIDLSKLSLGVLQLGGSALASLSFISCGYATAACISVANDGNTSLAASVMSGSFAIPTGAGTISSGFLALLLGRRSYVNIKSSFLSNKSIKL